MTVIMDEMMTDIDHFKLSLKTHLFKLAYDVM